MNRAFIYALVERLAWTLLHSLWQITAIAAALLLLRLLVKSPNIRYQVTMIALLGSLAWPAATFFKRSPAPLGVVFLGAQDTPNTVPPVISEPGAAAPLMKPQPAPGTVSRTLGTLVSRATASRSWSTWAVSLWLLGVVFMSLRQGLALWALHRLRSHGLVEVPPPVRALFDQARRRLRVWRRVRLCASARVLSPIVTGTLRPVIFLPASLLSGLPPAQLEALLAHELAHLRRWDDVANLVQCAIETLLFYHPVLWWMSRRAREDRELCCDDLATAQGIERRTLAEALGRLALWQAEPALAATGHMPVLARIRRLLQPVPARTSVNAWPWVLALLSVLALGWTTHAQAEPPPRGRILDRNGVVLVESPSPTERRHPFKKSMAHVLGYTGWHDPAHTRHTGRAGIEESMNEMLTAKKDVTLTLDVQLQQLAERTLEEQVSRAGAAVVMDVNTGEVLALASYPSFDLTDFDSGTISEERYKQLVSDKRSPLLGRAWQGAYSSASNFKLVTALAGLRKGVLDEQTRFESVPSYSIEGRDYHNWQLTNEGMLSLAGAIQRSCNTWFYQASEKMDADDIASMAADLGYGKPPGMPLKGEQVGRVPDDHPYLNKDGHKMPPGLKANMAIGQIVTCTPLQTAVAMAAIANGGRVLKPRLIKDGAAPQVVSDLPTKGSKPEHLALIRQALEDSVAKTGGLAGRARVDGLSVAGMTGAALRTGSVSGSKASQLAWFTGYAPADKPQYVVSIVYEGEEDEPMSGGAKCAPIAHDLFAGMRAQKLFTGILPPAESPPSKKPGERLLSENWLRRVKPVTVGELVVFCEGSGLPLPTSDYGQFTGNVLVVSRGLNVVAGEGVEVTVVKGKLTTRGPMSAFSLKRGEHPYLESLWVVKTDQVPERTPLEPEPPKRKPTTGLVLPDAPKSVETLLLPNGQTVSKPIYAAKPPEGAPSLELQLPPPAYDSIDQTLPAVPEPLQKTVDESLQELERSKQRVEALMKKLEAQQSSSPSAIAQPIPLAPTDHTLSSFWFELPSGQVGVLRRVDYTPDGRLRLDLEMLKRMRQKKPEQPKPHPDHIEMWRRQSAI